MRTYVRDMLLVGAGVLLALNAGAAEPGTKDRKKSDDPNRIVFNRDIRPILSENCYACHGPDKGKRKGKLRLDTKEGAFEKTESDGFAIVPGDTKKSLLLQRVLNADPEEHMPPKKSGKELTVAQIDLLKRWIEQGAEFQPHWSYIAPERADLPSVKNKNWCRSDIDYFILARLEQEKLQPSAEADRITQLRRLSLDLTGLPPTPEDVEAFLADKSKDAYEKQIDRLLASPHYGERMALYWLDLVRFADSAGYHSDNPRNIDPYRDYVIQAFNENKHFDQFTIEQLAGDMLPTPTVSQKVASGYNRLLQTTEEGGAQAKEYEAKYVADRVRNVASVWMAATMGCCECHDHKFDPYKTKEFYSMGAFFADIKESVLGRREAGMAVPDGKQDAEVKAVEEKIAALKKQFETSTPELVAAQVEWEKAQKALKQPEWLPLTALSAESSGGATMKIDKDIIAVSGKNPDKDNYTITCKTTLKGITALRLDILPDKALPANGPGRAANGNFVLHEFEATAAGKPVKFSAATATHSQNDFNIAAAIDGNPGSGWAILNETGKENHAVFEAKENIGADGETTLVVVMKHNYGTGHNIGRFRLWVTSAERPVKAGATLGLPKDLGDILALEAEKRSDAQKQKLAAHYRTLAPQLATLRTELAEQEKAKETLLKNVRMTLISTADNPRIVRVKPRGNWMDDSGEIVAPAVPSFLPQIDAKPGQARLNRMDLAMWMVSKQNPLPARVFVNRAWKMFFGQGISKSLEDLGSQGEWPTHPELLDWLAVDFRDHDWDIKRTVKQMLMSATYRQTSFCSKELRERDPYNRLAARQSRFRLDAELVRDNALSISGLLAPKVGGDSVRPYQPPGYWTHLNFPKRDWEMSKGEDVYRRGIYTWWQRSFLHPSLLAFDAPSREECTAERTRSNTPQQALVLLNDPEYVEAARVFAEHIIKQGGAKPEERLNWAFLHAVSRKPDADEVKVLGDLYRKHLEKFTADKKSAEQLIGIGPASVAKDIDAAELAAWTSVARTILNLHETITRF